MANLSTLNFDNSYKRLPNNFAVEVLPTALESPVLIAFNEDVAGLLDIDLKDLDYDELLAVCSGQKLLQGSEPIAMKYTGHQFGHYNPDLGDGRGLLLGEVVNQQKQRWDLHLKGCGKTPFSRFGDGRAVLRSSIREYLVSEAMYGLGIPTTRALALCGSDTFAMRQGMMEPCATVLRVTKCHIRFGHFEYFYHTRQHDDLKRLANYCLVRYFPDCLATANPYLSMYQKITEQTATMVAKWQAFGFVHAVLNTDNMSLISETFDYGPFSFMDNFKLNTISNHNDHEGRYAFGKQPEIVHWNLSALGQTLIPFIDKDAILAVLDSYPSLYKKQILSEYRKRLGLFVEKTEDAELMSDLQSLFARYSVDMNRFFRALSDYPNQTSKADLAELVSSQSDFSEWLTQYDARLLLEAISPEERSTKMLQINPQFILRNYMAQEAIAAAEKGDFTLVNDIAKLLKDPFKDSPSYQHYAQSPPDWASSIALTCSS